MPSRAERLISAFARGLVEALLAVDGAGDASTSPPPPARERPPAADLAAVPEGSSLRIEPQAFPQPGFDVVEEQPLPGFEGIPAASLRRMEEAIAAIERGEGVPPGYIDKDAPDGPRSTVPLS